MKKVIRWCRFCRCLSSELTKKLSTMFNLNVKMLFRVLERNICVRDTNKLSRQHQGLLWEESERSLFWIVIWSGCRVIPSNYYMKCLADGQIVSRYHKKWTYIFFVAIISLSSLEFGSSALLRLVHTDKKKQDIESIC